MPVGSSFGTTDCHGFFCRGKYLGMERFPLLGEAEKSTVVGGINIVDPVFIDDPVDGRDEVRINLTEIKKTIEGKPAVNVFRNRLKLFGEREVAGTDGDAGTDPFTGAGTDEAENAVPVGKAVYRQFFAGKILTDGVFGAV